MINVASPIPKQGVFRDFRRAKDDTQYIPLYVEPVYEDLPGRYCCTTPLVFGRVAIGGSTFLPTIVFLTDRAAPQPSQLNNSPKQPSYRFVLQRLISRVTFLGYGIVHRVALSEYLKVSMVLNSCCKYVAPYVLLEKC